MGEEFQAGICGGGNWWNPSRSVFSAAVASPCSMGLSHDVAGFCWPNNNTMVDETTKAKSNNSSGDDTNNSVCESPPNNNNNNNNNNIIINAFQEVLQKPQHSHQATDPITSGSLLIDSTLQMMGFDHISSDLAQHNNNLVRSNNGRSEMYSILQHDHGNYRQDHQFQPALSSGFSGSGSFGYNPTTLLQSLFDEETQQQQHSYSDYSLNYGSSNNNNTTNTTTTTTKHMSQPGCGLHFSNNTPYWNASEPMNVSDENNNNLQQRLSNNNFSSVPQLQQQYVTQTFDHKPKRINNNNNNNNTVNLTPSKSNMVCNEDQGHQDSRSTCVVKKTSSGNEQAVIKRARIETPSPLPTFKVRKEKLGDRITALQQLVSPFGKTDTASVLNEAIEYIKFLHDQVSVLSTPYMKNGGPIAQLNQQGSHKLKNNQETQKQDLKSRGLCLVPISSTFPVANETTADFWTPTFGGSFR